VSPRSTGRGMTDRARRASMRNMSTISNCPTAFLRAWRFLFGVFLLAILSGVPLEAAVQTPGAVLNGWPRGLRNTTYTYDVAVTNNSDEPRSLCVTTRRSPGLSGRIDNVTTGNPVASPQCQPYAAGQTRIVPVTYTMANSDWDGDAVQVFVYVSDELAPWMAVEPWFKITVATSIDAPPAESLQAGQRYRRSFRIHNVDPTGTARTYNLVPSGEGAVTNVQAEVPSVNVPPNGHADVNVDFTISPAAAGNAGRLALRAYDPAYPDREGTASVTYSFVPDPVLTVEDGSPYGLRGQTYTRTVTVRNPSDTPRRLCLEVGRSPGITANMDDVTQGPPWNSNVPCYSVGANGNAYFGVRYTMANGSWDGADMLVTLRAYDEALPASSATGNFKVIVRTDVGAPPAESLGEGRSVTRTFRVHNRNPFGDTYTYAMQARGDAVLTGVSVNPATAAIPAGGYADVGVTFSVAPGTAGQTGTLSFEAVHAAWDQRRGFGSMQVTPVAGDNTPPTITFNRQSGTTQNTPSFQLTIDFRDERSLNAGSLRIHHNGADVTQFFTSPTTPTHIQSSTTLQLAPGANTIRASIADSAGNPSEATLTVTYDADTTAPTVEFNKPSGTTQSTPSFQLTIDMRDDVSINPGSLRIDHNDADVTQYFSSPFSPPSYVQSSTTLQLAPGVNTIRVRITDTAGNLADRSLTVTYASDTTRPTIDFNRQDGTTQTTPSFQLTIDMRDDVALNPDSRRIFFNGADVTDVFVTTSTPPAWLQSSTTVQLNPGVNTIRVTIADTSNNVLEKTITVTWSTGTTPPPATPSSKFTAYTMYTSNIGNSHGIPLQYGGLDARQDRQWIHWTGCAPNWHPNGDPDLGYDVAAVHAFAAANRGKLYIYLDEPAHGSVGNHKTNYTTPGCTQITPAQYARAYRKFVDDLRAVDPTARVSPGGFEQVRATLTSYPTAFVEYATEFYDSYVAQFGAAPPVAEWRFHMYWENGIWTDPSDISGWQAKTERAVAFAQQHGAPLVVAIGYPWQEYDARMLTGMERMFAYLNASSTVVSVFWWSYDFWQDGRNRLTTFNNEATTARTLTVVGEKYRDLIAGASTPPPAGSPVTVTPDGATATVPPSSSGTQTFTVTNAGTASVTYALTATCSGAVTCGSPSLSQAALAPGQATPVTVNYTIAASGSGELRLTAVQTNVSTVTDSGSYQLSVAATPGTFTIDLSPHNAENLNFSQFSAELDYSTPSYVSFGAEHSVKLYYSSAQAAPSALVQVNVDDSSPAPPEQYSIRLYTLDGAPVLLTNGGYENFYRGAAGMTRLAAQADVPAGYPTGAYDLAVVVRKWRGGQVYAQSASPVRVLAVDERGSAVGPGWTIGSVQKIHVQGDGSLVVTSGLGSVHYYARPAGCGTPCTFLRPKGEWSEITFDGVHYVRRYPGGNLSTFAADGYLISSEDRYQNRTTYKYVDGRLEEITDPLGNKTVLLYAPGATGAHRLRSLVDFGGRTVTLTRDGADNITHIADPANTYELQGIEYDGSRLRGWTDRAGGRWDVSYDAAGMLASLTLPPISVAGQPASRSVTTSKSLHAAVLPPANSGTTLQAAAPNVAAATVETSTTDPRGKTTYVRFDRLGSPVWSKDPAGRVTTIQRNADSQPERTVDSTGHTTRNVWQGPLLMETADETAGTTVHYQYESGGWLRPLRIWGDTTETIYEYGTRPDWRDGTDVVKTRRTDTSFSAISYRIDSRGQITSESDAEGHGTEYRYDSLANVASVTSGTGGTSYRRGTRYETDQFGRVEEVYRLEPAASVLISATTYDVVNRVTSTKDEAQQVTAYLYTGERGLYKVTDPLGQTYTYKRNVLGWLEEEVDPAGLSIRYTYDAGGNMLTVQNRRGQVVAFGYDDVNRTVYRDADNARTTYTYAADGRKVTIANAESTNEFIVDAAGRPDLSRVRVGPATITMDETVNRRGQREELAVSGPWSTRSIGYGYTAQGQMERLRDFNGETTLLVRNGDGVVTQTYYPRFGILHESGSLHTSHSNNYTGITAGPNPGVGYNFGAAARIEERYPAATATRYWKYRYDPVGRLKAAEEWDRAPDVCISDPDRGYVCEPDPAYSPAPRPRRQYGYSYDVVGNPSATVATVRPGNRLTGFKGFVMQYDEDGNLKTRYTPDWWTFNQTLTWNSLGQLVQVNGVSYGYDGLGRRVRRTSDGVTQYYVYDDDDLLMELGADGSIHREYVHFPGTDEPHSVRYWQYGMNGATHYYATQEPGNVTGLVDAFGKVVNEFRYDPFGNAEPGFENDDSQNPLRFASREWDRAAGLYYMRNRWYSPVLERFISEDPIGLEGGINTYAYADNDPVNGADAFGLKKDCSDKERAAGKCTGTTPVYLEGIVVMGRMRIRFPVATPPGMIGRYGWVFRGTGEPPRDAWQGGGPLARYWEERKDDIARQLDTGQCMAAAVWDGAKAVKNQWDTALGAVGLTTVGLQLRNIYRLGRALPNPGAASARVWFRIGTEAGKAAGRTVGGTATKGAYGAMRLVATHPYVAGTAAVAAGTALNVYCYESTFFDQLP
jgi:RHS repeat-associated protein